jgi:hypothetical protein
VLHAFEFAICVIRSDSKRQNNDLAWTLSDWREGKIQNTAFPNIDAVPDGSFWCWMRVSIGTIDQRHTRRLSWKSEGKKQRLWRTVPARASGRWTCPSHGQSVRRRLRARLRCGASRARAPRCRPRSRRRRRRGTHHGCRPSDKKIDKERKHTSQSGAYSSIHVVPSFQSESLPPLSVRAN